MEKIIIKSLEEYIGYIHSMDKDYVLSRGQERDKSLLPSVLRVDDSNMRLYSKAKAKGFIEDFKNNSIVYIDSTIHSIQNDFEWIVYAQHFGVPTCLLDSTYSHLVSLMFAVENAFRIDLDEDENSVVWFLRVCESFSVNRDLKGLL
jgi:hypothetical protein